MGMDFVPELFEKEAGRPRYVIDAIIEYEYVETPKAAKLAYWVEDNYTEEQQGHYYDFINTVESVITSFGFEITAREQNNISPSYYFNFVPKDVDGNEMDEITVRFRISDHPPKRGGDNVTVKAIFKSFWFGNEKYPDQYSLIFGVEEACRAIQRGDFSRLMEL